MKAYQSRKLVKIKIKIKSYLSEDHLVEIPSSRGDKVTKNPIVVVEFVQRNGLETGKTGIFIF